MKNKILIFIIGFLVGAIIATVGFYFYEKNNNSQEGMAPNGNMPQMMNQENGGTPPQKPSGEQGDNQGTPPEKPSNGQSDQM